MRSLCSLCLCVLAGSGLLAGCDDEEEGPSVGELVQASDSLCQKYGECDAAYDVATCQSDGETEADRLAGLTGDDCQGYVDRLAAYNSCLASETCDALENDPNVCAAESAAVATFAAEDGFDCPGAI